MCFSKSLSNGLLLRFFFHFYGLEFGCFQDFEFWFSFQGLGSGDLYLDSSVQVWGLECDL